MGSGDDMEYIYKSPVESGFIRLKISRRHHNKLLPNRKKRIGAKIEYYYHKEENMLTIQYLTLNSFKAIIIPIMFLPSILMVGIPKTFKDITDLIYERKRGRFTCDDFFLNHEKTTDGALENFIAESINR